MPETKTKHTITIEEITRHLQENDLATARRLLAARTGARLSVTGRIEKTVKRDGLKLVINPVDLPEDGLLTVFADFPQKSEREKLKRGKYRKGKEITVSGNFQTFGLQAVNLTDCFIRSANKK